MGAVNEDSPVKIDAATADCKFRRHGPERPVKSALSRRSFLAGLTAVQAFSGLPVVNFSDVGQFAFYPCNCDYCRAAFLEQIKSGSSGIGHGQWFHALGGGFYNDEWMGGCIVEDGSVCLMERP